MRRKKYSTTCWAGSSRLDRQLAAQWGYTSNCLKQEGKSIIQNIRSCSNHFLTNLLFINTKWCPPPKKKINNNNNAKELMIRKGQTFSVFWVELRIIFFVLFVCLFVPSFHVSCTSSTKEMAANRHFAILGKWHITCPTSPVHFPNPKLCVFFVFFVFFCFFGLLLVFQVLNFVFCIY